MTSLMREVVREVRRDPFVLEVEGVVVAGISDILKQSTNIDRMNMVKYY